MIFSKARNLVPPRRHYPEISCFGCPETKPSLLGGSELAMIPNIGIPRTGEELRSMDGAGSAFAENHNLMVTHAAARRQQLVETVHTSLQGEKLFATLAHKKMMMSLRCSLVVGGHAGHLDFGDLPCFDQLLQGPKDRGHADPRALFYRTPMDLLGGEGVTRVLQDIENSLPLTRLIAHKQKYRVDI